MNENDNNLDSEHSIDQSNQRRRFSKENWIQHIRFPNGAQPEIIRAEQKDEYIINNLKNQIASVIRSIKGSRWINGRENQLESLSQLVYLSLTNLTGSPTLGEEYCDILQYDSSINLYPRFMKRFILILIQVLSPHFLSKIYRVIYDWLNEIVNKIKQSDEDNNNNDNNNNNNNYYYYRLKMMIIKRFLSVINFIFKLIPTTIDRNLINQLKILHLAIFYLNGKYFNWSKRLTKIRYISNRLRPLKVDGKGRIEPPSYEILGLMMIIQLMIRLIGSYKIERNRQQELSIRGSDRLSLKKNFEEEEKEEEKVKFRIPTVDGKLIDEIVENSDSESEEDEDEDEEKKIKERISEDDYQSKRCTLCLGNKKHQTSLECGHVFCWKCVVNWVKEKPECPLCRQPVKLSQLLPLYNF